MCTKSFGDDAGLLRRRLTASVSPESVSPPEGKKSLQTKAPVLKTETPLIQTSLHRFSVALDYFNLR